MHYIEIIRLKTSWEDCLFVQLKMTKSTVKHFQVQPACGNSQINSDMLNSPKRSWYKDVKEFASEMQVNEKKNIFKNIVEKLKYNEAFYENDANRGMKV